MAENKKLAKEVLEYFQAFGKRQFKNAEKRMHGELAVLMYLQDKESSPTEISNHFNISTARAANILNTLEDKKLIVRTHSVDDRRKVKVEITKSGNKHASDSYSNMINEVVELFDSLGEPDTLEFVRIMKRISEIMGEEEIDNK